MIIFMFLKVGNPIVSLEIVDFDDQYISECIVL